MGGYLVGGSFSGGLFSRVYVVGGYLLGWGFI